MLTTTLAAVGLAVVSVTAGQPLEDQLISSVDGYMLLPPSGVSGMGSGPLSGADLAEVGGLDPSDIQGLDDVEGYLQAFAADEGERFALVLGIDLGAGEAAGFLGGFEGSAETQGASDAIPLFPDETGALGDLVYYEFEVQGMDGLITAFMAGDLGISAQVFEDPDGRQVLQEMVRDQHALTPVTASTAGSAPAPDGDDAAEQVGRIVGTLLLLGAIVGIPTYLVTRARRRRHPQPQTPWAPYPGYPPAGGYPQSPPPGYPPAAGAPQPPAPPGSPPAPPPPPRPPGPSEPGDWSSPQ